jgi:hypothetical protein
MSCQAHTTGQGSFLYQLSIQHKSCHLWDLWYANTVLCFC